MDAEHALSSIDRFLQPMEVICYFKDNQSSSHHDLIKHFRPLLVNSEFAKENHELLKKVTGQLVIVKKIQGSKCLELKPSFLHLSPHEIYVLLELATEEENPVAAPPIPPRSRNPIYEPISLPNEEAYFLPPKVHEEKESLVPIKASAKSSIPLASIKEEPPKDNNDDDDEVFATLSRAEKSVKDLSKRFEIAHQEQIHPHSNNLRARVNRTEKPVRKSVNSDNPELDLVPALTEETRAWILAAAKNDEATMRRLVNSSPDVIHAKDPAMKYSALHWAAKFGNVDMIHLLIGRYRMSANVKTRGGYTPLMIAAMHRQLKVYELLLKAYGANPDLRDHSGRKASWYLPPDDDGEDQPDEEEAAKRFHRQSLRRKAKIDRSPTFLGGLLRESKRRHK